MHVAVRPAGAQPGARGNQADPAPGKAAAHDRIDFTPEDPAIDRAEQAKAAQED